MKVAVIGTGYVGLVTGTCLAESGNDLACVDNNAAKIDLLNGGGLPIYEPGLQELVARNRKEGRLTFTTDLATAAQAARLIFIAVGTPQSDQGDAGHDAGAIANALNAEGFRPPKHRGSFNKPMIYELRLIREERTWPSGSSKCVAGRTLGRGSHRLGVAGF